MNTNDTHTNDTTAKVDSFRFLKLIKHIHIAGDRSTTALLWQLCAMADGRTGECYPSISYLAVKTGWSEDTIPRAADKLCALGLVTVLNRNYQSNLYALNYDALLALKETCASADRELLDAARGKKATKQYRRRTRRSAEKSVAPENEGYKDEPVAPESGVCSPEKGDVVARKSDVCSPQTDEFVAPENKGLTTQYRTIKKERLKHNEKNNVSPAVKNCGTGSSAYCSSISGSSTSEGQSHSDATPSPANFVAPKTEGYEDGAAAPQKRDHQFPSADTPTAPAPVINENVIRYLTQEIRFLEKRPPDPSVSRTLERYKAQLAGLEDQSAQATQQSQGATA